MSDAGKTLYDVLGISPDASPPEIERACLKLGDRYRPDKNPGDANAAQMFAAFETAFVTLVDPAKRAAYDKSIGVTSLAVEDQVASNRPSPNNSYGAVEITRHWSDRLVENVRAHLGLWSLGVCVAGFFSIAIFGDHSTSHAAHSPESAVKEYLHDAIPGGADLRSCSQPKPMSQGSLVRCTYEARNAFNGLVRETSAFYIRDGQAYPVDE